MSLTFLTNTIAVFRPTHKEYDFLEFNRTRHGWSLMSPPTVEGIHKNYPHVLAGRETFLQFWNTTGRKTLQFHVLDDILKLAGPAGQNVWIPVIRLNRRASYHNTFNKIKKNTLANVVAPPGTQIGQWNEVIPVPAPVPAPGPTVAPPPVPNNTLRTPVIIPSNLPRSMIPHFKEVAQSMDKILTNNSISTQEKASQIMNRYARSIREVIKTVEREKTVPQFVAQLVAQHSVENGEMCPITCDDITVDEAAVTSCYHVFSKESIEMYRAMGNMTCPICRQECSITRAL
jgi:hypothetical protein